MAHGRGRRIVEWLLLVVAIAVGIPAAAWFAQEQLIFHPQPAAGSAGLPAHAKPLELTASDGTRLAGFELQGTERPGPVLLYFGGNAEEISGSLADLRWPPAWTIAGVNYRGYGNSEGKPGEKELVTDALVLFDAIAARNDVDARRIVVVGRSLGTGVAAQVAAQRPVAGAILISPYDSLVELARIHYPWLPVDTLLRHRFEALKAIGTVRVPMLAIVGAADGIIPSARSRALYDGWPGPKTWLEIPGAGHNDLGSTPDYWTGIAHYLASLPPRR